MTNTDITAEADDRATYELWKAAQYQIFEDYGNSHWWDDTKARRMHKRGSTHPVDPFAGPLWAARPWMTQEAIDWFTVAGNQRLTWADWQRMQRENRAAQAEYDAAASSPLATLEYMRDMQARRGALIAEARAEGASWADVMAATGLSRMQAHTLAKEYALNRPADVTDDSEEPF